MTNSFNKLSEDIPIPAVVIKPPDALEKKSCEICGKTFSKSSNMLQHVKSKHNGRKFRCEVCELTCVSMDSLNRHIGRKHKNRRGDPVYTPTMSAAVVVVDGFFEMTKEAMVMRLKEQDALIKEYEEMIAQKDSMITNLRKKTHKK